jgi:hypothetical protein
MQRAPESMLGGMRITPKLLLAALTVVATVTVSAVQEPESKPSQSERLGKLIPREDWGPYGFSKLSFQEREQLADLIDGLVREIQLLNASRKTAMEAERYMERQGWEKMTCGIISRDGKNYFVVKKLYGADVTEDIPLGLYPFSVPSGEYWCKDNFFGGIERIFVNGVEHDFPIYTDWEDV